MLALGVALKRRGHDVIFSSGPNERGAAEGKGLAFSPVGPDAHQMVRDLGERVFDPRVFFGALRDASDAAFDQVHALCADRDLLVSNPVFSAAASVAELNGIPHALAICFPNFAPTREVPPVVFDRTFPMPLNGFTWWLFERIADMALGSVLNPKRRAYGLPPLAGMKPWLRSMPVLLAFDSAVAHPPGDWTFEHHTTGYWVLESDEPLPAALERFLSAGPRPVYIGFGSMPCRDPEGRTRVLLEAIERAGVRAVIGSGWAGLGEGSVMPESVICAGSVDHAKLFPRCAAVVHHGGAGTTGTAARAGVPQVVVPHGFDQPYWADRMHALGVATRRVSRKLEAGPLAAALTEATETPRMKQLARELAAKLVPDGADRAAALLEGFQRRGRA